MLRSKTVLVIGAGASYEAGLPIGETLKSQIADILSIKENKAMGGLSSGDALIHDALSRKYGAARHEWLKSCRRIRDGVQLSASIDDFLDIHKDDEHIVRCGKIAIARAILAAEQTSTLYVDSRSARTIKYSALLSSWYPRFFQFATQGVSKANVEDVFKDLCVVSFNYDRCLEQFLFHALRDSYHLKDDHVAGILQKLTVYRPYGSVGPLFSTSREGVPFGWDVLPDIDTLAANIKTYTEQIEAGEHLFGMREAMATARTILFLGNAYHPNNMKLLTPDQSWQLMASKIFATRRGILSSEDLDIVDRRLMQFHRPVASQGDRKILFADTCFELFQNFRWSIRD